MTIVAFIIGIVLLVVGLAVSIALHELGHLWPAKKFGVRVGQYMIGFGPTLWSRRKGETEYGFKAIPLGGYISMAGMYPPSPRELQAQAAGSRGGRAGGGFFATMVLDARAANDQTLQGDDDDRVFYKLPVWKRVVIMLGGPTMNLLLAIVLFTIIVSGIGVQTVTTTVGAVSACVPADSQRTECEASDPAPAADAGLKAGDELISVGGTPIDSFAEASAIIRESPGTPLEVVVERDGERVTLTMTPVAKDVPQTDAAGNAVIGADGDPVMTEAGVAGISALVELQPQPIWQGPAMAFENVGAVASVIWRLPVMVWQTGVATFTGQERDPNGPLSVVGAGVLAGEVAAADAPLQNRIAGFLGLLASLNIALFVFNLIPLLPLDGGHVAVALWDGLKRAWAKLFRRPPPKPVDATKLVPVTFVVVVALIAMGAVLIISDVVNPVSLLG